MISNPFENTYFLYLVFLALILTLSSYRSLYGGKYRPFRVFFRPAIYLLLGLGLLSQDFTDPLFITSLLGLLAGALMGVKLGSGVSFYYSGGDLYYKRSVWVYLLWLASFLLRAYLEVGSPTSFTVLTLLDALLMFSSGLLLGESCHLVTKTRVIRRDGVL